MTSNPHDTDMAHSRSDNRTPMNPQIKYAQRLKSTPTQASRPSTHLGITISWGAPRVARQGRDWCRGAGSC